MSGLISTGLGYQQTATSGLELASQLQQQEDVANAQFKAQKKMQEEQMLGTIGGSVLGAAAYFLVPKLIALL